MVESLKFRHYKPVFRTVRLSISQFQAWPSPRANPRGSFWKDKFPTLQAQRKCETPAPGAEKLCQSPTPGQLFSKIQQKNRTYLRILKQWNIKKPKFRGGIFLWIFKTSQIILHSSINQHKKFMTSKYQNKTLMTATKFEPTFSLVFQTGYRSRTS